MVSWFGTSLGGSSNSGSRPRFGILISIIPLSIRFSQIGMQIFDSFSIYVLGLLDLQISYR